MRCCLRERVIARVLSAKLITAFICDFYSGVQRGPSFDVFDIRLLLCNELHWNPGYMSVVSNLVHRCPCKNFELRHPYVVNTCIYICHFQIWVDDWMLEGRSNNSPKFRRLGRKTGGDNDQGRTILRLEQLRWNKSMVQCCPWDLRRNGIEKLKDSLELKPIKKESTCQHSLALLRRRK